MDAQTVQPVEAPFDPALLLLLIAVPLAAAALSTLIKHRGFDRTLMIGSPTFVGAAAVVLLIVHRDHPVLAHSVGGYLNGLAIPFVSDTFSALMLLITSIAAILCGWFRRGPVPVRPRAHPHDAHGRLRRDPHR